MQRTSAIPISFILPLVLLAAAAFGTSWYTATALAQDGEGDTIVLRNGDGEPGYTINAFLPQDITIRTGTTVRWEFPFGEPHSATFGEPGAPTASGSEFDGTSPVNSNVIFGGNGETWELVFTAEGEFEFYCLIHDFQTMTVTVTDDEAVDVDTQDAVDARADAYFSDAMARIKAIADDVRDAGVETDTLDDGSTRHTVVNGAGTEDGHDALQYFPTSLTITAGDTVRWTNSVPVPHTVSLGAPPEFTDPFEVEASLPGDAYDGQGFWNSGAMFGIPGAIPGTIQEFELIFDTPGTYDYYCLFHAPIGHEGQIVVQAASDDDDDDASPTTTPGAPSTGSGVMGGTTGSTTLLAGGSLLLVAFALFGYRAARTGARS